MKLVARLKGGVGNQLFIYAMAYAVAKKQGCELILDRRSGFFRDPYKRKNKMRHFKISYHLYSLTPFLFFIARKMHPVISRTLFGSWVLLLERDIKNYEEIVLPKGANQNIILDGQWQCPKYFADVSESLAEEFRFKDQEQFQRNPFYNSIICSRAIGIHVRRVEYNNRLPFSYYLESLKYMNSVIENPHYFVFSDDIDWCKTAFSSISNTYFVEYSNQNDIEDLFLLSQCKSFIIANSSFSWWGAWLSNSNDKIVLAPREFKLTNDLYESEWIEI